MYVYNYNIYIYVYVYNYIGSFPKKKKFFLAF